MLDRFAIGETIYYVSNDFLLQNPDNVSCWTLVARHVGVVLSDPRIKIRPTVSWTQIIGKSFKDFVAKEDWYHVLEEINMAKSWAASSKSGVHQSSFAYVAFALVQEVSCTLATCCR